MALFGSKKKKDLSAEASAKAEAPNPPAGGEVKEVKKAPAKKPAVKKVVNKAPAVVKPQAKESVNFTSVLVQPRITEKATVQTENGVYVFEVATDATKKEIGSAVKHYYNVSPVKVNIVKIPSKKVSSRTTRKKGVKAGGKKAYVFLKKGDKIEIV
ncbi:MAG: 50S ribosomal protein L23 [Parcubacteria group bacterium]|nr:50S ribosomal protein L23 [Parcubacteria group bacterium]